jgi:hypothetical protein
MPPKPEEKKDPASLSKRLPHRFDGNEDDLARFEFECKVHALSNKELSPEVQTKMILASLDGPALLLAMSVTKYGDELSKPAELIAALHDHILPGTATESARQKFLELKQTPEQSAATFLLAFDSAVKSYESAAEFVYTPQLLLDALKQRLLPDYLEYLMHVQLPDDNKKWFATASAALRRHDDVRRLRTSSTAQQPTTMVLAVTHPPSPSSTTSASGVICHNCGATGHFARDCPTPRSTGPSQRNRFSRDRGNRGRNGNASTRSTPPGNKLYCHLHGPDSSHTTEDCRKLQQLRQAHADKTSVNAIDNVPLLPSPAPPTQSDHKTDTPTASNPADDNARSPALMSDSDSDSDNPTFDTPKPHVRSVTANDLSHVTVHAPNLERPVVSLLDGGAGVSVVHPRVLKAFTPCNPRSLGSAAAATSLHVIGSVKLALSIPGQPAIPAVLHNFFVSPNVTHDLLIGRDFLRHHQVVVDYHAGLANWGQFIVPLEEPPRPGLRATIPAIARQDRESDVLFAQRHKTRVQERINELRLMGHLSALQLQRVEKLLLQYSAVFDDRLPFVIPDSRMQHKILLKPGFDTAGKPRHRMRYSPEKLKSLYEWRDEYLEKGFIKVWAATGSPYNNNILASAPRHFDSTILPVHKAPDPAPPGQPMGPAKTRWVINPQNLNSATVRDNIETPDIEQFFDGLAGSSLFNAGDLLYAYYQITNTPDTQEYTAFTLPGDPNTYVWSVMAMGLLNSAETLYRATAADFGHLPNTKQYRDELIQHASDFEHLFALTREWFQVALTKSWKFKFSKTKLFVPRLDFLGRTVDKQGMHADDRHVHALLATPRPATKSKLRSFLGMTAWHRKFIQDYASIAAPLTAATTDSAPKQVQWSPPMAHAYTTLMDRIKSLPTLGHPDLRRPFVIETDASNSHMGAVLLQPDSHGRDFPVAYWSQAIPATARNWSTRRKEALAKFRAVLHWEPLIDNGHVTVVRSDHQSLSNQPEEVSDAVVVRMNDKIAHLSLQHQYRAGKQLQVVDYLSRTPPTTPSPWSDTADSSVRSVMDPLPALADNSVRSVTDPLFDTTSFISAYNSCSDAKEILESMETGRNKRHALTTDGAIVLSADPRRRFVPTQYRHDVLSLLHGHALTGHGGVDKTLERARRDFTWPQMDADVKAFVAACLGCQLRKFPPAHNIGQYTHPPVPERMTNWSSDYFGPLPADSEGYTHIATFSDETTGFLHIAASKGTTGPALIEATNGFITTHGVPVNLLHDRGSNYTSAAFQTYAARLGFRLRPTMALAPWTNGRSEAVNAPIAQYLTQFVQDNQHRTWRQHLPALAFSYNTSAHSTTGQTPFFLAFGRHPRLPLHNHLPPQPPSPLPAQSAELVTTLHDALERARTRTHAHHVRLQARAAPTQRMPTFHYGDLVTLWYGKDNAPRLDGVPKKLVNNRTGPFTILARLSPFRYRIKSLDADTTQEVHVKRLRAYFPLPARLRPHPGGNTGPVAAPPVPLPAIAVAPLPAHVPAAVQPAPAAAVNIPAAVVDVRRFGNSVRYRVRWQGFHRPEDETWQTSYSLRRHQLLIDDFFEANPAKRSVLRRRR